MSNEVWKTAFKDLMPFAVASTMAETLRELEWKQKLTDYMNAVFLMAVVPVANSMIRAFVGPELEKRGLNPLTDWHWQVFQQETEAKVCLMAWREEFDRMCREVAEREIIRKFVWERG